MGARAILHNGPAGRPLTSSRLASVGFHAKLAATTRETPMRRYMTEGLGPAQGDVVARVARSLRTGLVAAGALTALLVAFAGPASAQETLEVQAHFGRSIYKLFCVGCHGDDGRGNPAVAEALDLPTVDLTAIKKRNGGVFPADEVAAAIAGTRMGGHRDLAPEPWARIFADDFERFAEQMAVNALVARRIDHLVAYLESIQED